MEQISLRVEVEINPTESEEKVRKAVQNIFGNLRTEIKRTNRSSMFIGEANGKEALFGLCNLLRRERIRNAARKPLLAGIDRRSISFFLNKQVAYAGHLSFSKETAESPLGPIKVAVICEDPRQIVNWLTSKETRE